MKYLNPTFSAGPNSNAYRDNWEQTFGGDEPEPILTPELTRCLVEDYVLCHRTDRPSSPRGWDDEAAHAGEDEVRSVVLEAIAKGLCSDPAQCARIALSTTDLDFFRWYA